MLIKAWQSGLTAAALFMLAVTVVALVAFSAAPLVRDAWRKWRKRGSAAVAIGGIAIATIYGGGKPHVVPHAGADDGIALLAIEAEYTNEVTVVEVKYTAGDVTTATPVSVRNAESEQWRELEKVGATITPGQTNVLAFTVAEDVAAYRYWWVGVDLPAVVVESQGITITNFVATSKHVRIDWTCDDPKATVFSIQRKRKKPAGIPYDAEVEYLQSSGTQYIDTGIYPNGGTDWELCMFTPRDVNQNAFGSRNVSSGMPAWGLIAHGSGHWSINRLGSSWNTQFPRRVGTVNVYAFRNGVATYNGEPKGTYSGNVQVNYPAIMFGYNSGGRRALEAVQGILYCKIWQDGVLVRDFIPVRIGNVGAMYDRVSGGLFRNNGTGAFTYGGDTFSYDVETVGTTTSNSFQYDGFTVGEDWEWRVTSTYTEGEP